MECEQGGARQARGLAGFEVDGVAQESAPGGEFPGWKRLLDLTLVFVTFPLWMTVMILVAVWIKLVSPGPVFYRQERVGLREKRFLIFKFRSMKVNAGTVVHERYFENLVKADCPMTKLDLAGDPRLIPGGRLIRAMALDEVPQLFNVLRGEMSLVGPRPCTPRELESYQAWQHARFDAPPGLTGYWQVNGKNKTTFSQMIHMDIHYARQMNLGLDLKIIFQTVPTIIGEVLEARRLRVRQERGEMRPRTGRAWAGVH